jgi:hypothetical protein
MKFPNLLMDYSGEVGYWEAISVEDDRGKK